MLWAGYPALLDGILDSRSLNGFDLDGDGIQRFLHRKEQVALHVNGCDFGFNLEEEDMVTVDDDLSALVEGAMAATLVAVGMPARVGVART